MRHKQTIIKSVIRFRRWSRKSYAIFIGLGKQISIGRLRCGIADQAMRKNELILGRSMSQDSGAYTNTDEWQISDTDPSALLSLLSGDLLLKSLLPVNSSKSVCPFSNKNNTIFTYSNRVTDNLYSCKSSVIRFFICNKL